MGEGLSIGKTWTVNVPASSTRTVSPNLWQYSLFPTGTTPSVMYPSDGLSNFNDSQLMNFDYGVSSLMDTSTRLYAQVMPMMKLWMAQQAEMYQKIMSSLHSNTNVTVNNSNNNDNTEIDGTTVIKEKEIANVLNKIANNPDYKNRFNKEITITNKDGKEEKTTLLRRLIDLSKQYQDDPTTAEISEDNYKLLWDIAGKYAKTGELSTEDYGKLLEIAKNPGGPGAYTEPEEENDENENKGVRPAKNQEVLAAAEAGSPDNYKSLAKEYVKALYEAWGTDVPKLYDLTNEKHMNEYNVLEVYNEFGQLGEARKYGETLVDAIFADCAGWGGGEAFWGLGSNDAKPHITAIDKAFVTRAEHFAQNNPEVAAKYGFLHEVLNPSDEQKKGLIEVGGKYYDPKKVNVPATLIDNKQRNVTSENIKAFAERLTKAEKEAYGEE